jgi:hypothetical protein
MLAKPANGLRAIVLGLLVSSLVAQSAAAGERGRHFEPGLRSRLTFSYGELDPFDASVRETDRPINELRAENQRDNAEFYSIEDFGFEQSHDIWGIAYEYAWKHVSIFADTSRFSADAVATAPRDLFLSVDEIGFDGRTFDYQAIPVGTLYDAELTTNLLNTRVAYTPWTFAPGGTVQFVPWVHLGVVYLAADFDIDAGPALGVQLYENPPREYVINGSGSGDVSGAGPELGFGGELTARLGERSRLVLQANASVFQISATTGELGFSSRREKALDYDYRAADLRLYFETPITAGSLFLVGLQYKWLDIDALSEALERPEDEVLELREKFNKDIHLDMSTVNLTIGFRF